MDKIRSIADLKKMAQSAADESGVDKVIIRACNTGCRARKSQDVIKALEDMVVADGLQDRVEIRKTGCHGFCEMGPILVIEPDNIFYRKVKPEDIPEIISETILKGNVVDRLLWIDPSTKEPCKTEKEIPFYSRQNKTFLSNCGRIDPADIISYIAAGGYSALCKALLEMTPSSIIESIVDSKLRGRGGGGFPAGRKWKICSSAPGDARYIIANGDEGDPGAFMDRSLMEGDPHSIIEGMIIGGYAIGASEGYIYVREEYPIAIEHLSIALKQAEEYGLLGSDILGTGFNLSIHISRGAGAFVCGESTALMYSIEGKRGMPRSRPPNSVYSGLRGKPTVLNNVETFANVPSIIAKGAQWYAGIGTSQSKGTKIFSLVGNVKNTGLVEVEMGTTLREIIFDIGGGTRGGRSFKAVQTGGPSGGCIPLSKLDMPVDYDSLKEAGAIMGSGGMIVMDDSSCMVDVARYFIDFLMYESCGKCVPCREGLKQMHRILDDICKGKGQEDDISLLIDLGEYMTTASLCGLGTTAANPVLSTIRHFRNEYETHIHDGKCRAGVCKELFDYVVDPGKCNGCSLCRIKCPEEAVFGEKKKQHSIDTEKCIKCGICFSACKFEAILIQ